MILRVKKLINIVLGMFYLKYYSVTGRVKVFKNVRVVGIPLFNIDSNSQLFLGQGVTLNSFNDDYHVGMYSSVKIFIENKGSSIEIGENTRIHGSCIHASKKITIGRRCLIAANCNIMDSNGHKVLLGNPSMRYKSTDEPREVVIGDDVWIGMNSIILPGVTIGAGAIVAANSVVHKDIPPSVIVRGNPAEIIEK